MSKEADKPRELYALIPSPNRMPPDWKPPAPAWSASFAQQTTPVVMAYFGTQFESRDDRLPRPRVQKFFTSADAPDNLENATFRDREGCYNLVSCAYWTDPARYERWRDESGFEA